MFHAVSIFSTMFDSNYQSKKNMFTKSVGLSWTSVTGSFEDIHYQKCTHCKGRYELFLDSVEDKLNVSRLMSNRGKNKDA